MTVYTAELKVKFVPVLEIARICGSGIRASLQHGEVDRIHLREDIGPHGDADWNGHLSPVVCNIDLAVVGPGRQSAGGQEAGVDRYADRGRRGAAEGGRGQPFAAIRGAGRQCPINVPVPAFLI